jgi:hypothetical protein
MNNYLENFYRPQWFGSRKICHLGEGLLECHEHTVQLSFLCNFWTKYYKMQSQMFVIENLKLQSCNMHQTHPKNVLMYPHL